MALLGWMYGEKTKRQLQNFGATTTKKKEVNSRGFLDILITGYNLTIIITVDEKEDW